LPTTHTTIWFIKNFFWHSDSISDRKYPTVISAALKVIDLLLKLVMGRGCEGICNSGAILDTLNKTRIYVSDSKNGNDDLIFACVKLIMASNLKPANRNYAFGNFQDQNMTRR